MTQGNFSSGITYLNPFIPSDVMTSFFRHPDSIRNSDRADIKDEKMQCVEEAFDYAYEKIYWIDEKGHVHKITDSLGNKSNIEERDDVLSNIADFVRINFINSTIGVSISLKQWLNFFYSLTQRDIRVNYSRKIKYCLRNIIARALTVGSSPDEREIIKEWLIKPSHIPLDDDEMIKQIEYKDKEDTPFDEKEVIERIEKVYYYIFDQISSMGKLGKSLDLKNEFIPFVIDQRPHPDRDRVASDVETKFMHDDLGKCIETKVWLDIFYYISQDRNRKTFSADIGAVAREILVRVLLRMKKLDKDKDFNDINSMSCN